MYEYIIRKAENEAKMEKLVNAAAEAGWEVDSYAIRPGGGIFFLIAGSLWADHFVIMRRRKDV
jgi:hypothetical protein